MSEKLFAFLADNGMLEKVAFMEALPSNIKRWCCQGKSCGNTELELRTETKVDGPFKTHFYQYVRVSNERPYSGPWKDHAAMCDWLLFTKNNLNPEEGS